MKIAFVGKPNIGSWQIRAIQMSLQLRKMGIVADSFDVKVNPIPRGYDRIVYVKRGLPSVWPDHCPVFWDAVDFWKQPHQDVMTGEQAIILAKSMVPSHVGIIAATQRMASDLGCRHVYHHYRPGLFAHPLRDKARIPVVLYEGNMRYLGRYEPEFRKYGKFVQGSATERCDAVLAVRDAPYNGYMSRHWKSNVKAANALAIGRLIITDGEAGCMETTPSPCRIIVRNPGDVAYAVDCVSINFARKAAFEASREVASRYSIENVAKRFLEVVS